MKTPIYKSVMPRAAMASKSYAAYKFLLSFLFITYFIGSIAWTAWCMKYFGDQIDEDNESALENQRNRTHIHFFLFTGLYILAATFIGLWGVLKENMNVLLAFFILYLLGGLFELTGAFRSDNDDVKDFKLISSSVEPVLIVLSLIFSLMIRATEKRLSSLPIYRQTMAESRRNSLTKDEIPTYCNEGGQDNPNLDLSDEQPPPQAPGKPRAAVTGANFLQLPKK